MSEAAGSRSRSSPGSARKTTDTVAHAPEGITVRLFDGDAPDRRLPLTEALRLRLRAHQLLWVDICGAAPAEAVAIVGRRIELGPEAREALLSGGRGPTLVVGGRYVHLRVMTLQTDREEPGWLDVVAGRNMVVTRHAEVVPFLERLDARIERDATLGRSDAVTFVRAVLDAAVTTYFEAGDAIEGAVDRLDARSLRARADDDLLEELVELRHAIAVLRRALVAHRELYTTLPDLDYSEVAPGEGSAAVLASVAERYEASVRGVEGSRDLLLGSFDVYMTRIAQRSNDIMKVLAISSVLLLPGSLIAGLLGMNVSVPLSKDDPASFWIVVGAVALLITVVLVLAVRAGWIRRPR